MLKLVDQPGSHGSSQSGWTRSNCASTRSSAVAEHTATNSCGRLGCLSGTWRFAGSILHEAHPTATASPRSSFARNQARNQSGSYFATHRWYDPGPGRWTTPDPVMRPWSNTLSYVYGEPLRRLDPAGTNPAAAALLGCLSGAVVSVAWDAIVDGLEGEELDPCKYLVSAIVGCVSGVLAGALGAGWLNVKTYTTLKGAATQLGVTIPAKVTGYFTKLKCDKNVDEDQYEFDREDFYKSPLVSDEAKAAHAIGEILEAFRPDPEKERQEEERRERERQEQLDKCRKDVGEKRPKWFDAFKEFPCPYGEDGFGYQKCLDRCIEESPWYVGRELAQAYCENECDFYIENAIN